MADVPHNSQNRWIGMAASPLVQLQVLLVLAILLGGGGAAYGLRNLLIQFAALVILALNGARVVHFWRESGLWLRLLVAATLALPLIQLIPLPPYLWQDLPGRAAVLASHQAAGLGDALWFPLSMDRARTLVAFTGLIVPATVVMLGASLNERQKVSLAWTLVVAATAAMMWGIVQLQTGNSFGLFYPIRPHVDVLYATFANRNSTGLLFVIACLFAVGIARPEQSRRLTIPAILAVLLAIAVVLTQSRSSMVLLALPLLLVAIRLVQPLLDRSRQGGGTSRTAVIGVGLLAVMLVGAVAVSATQGGRAATSLARFGDLETDRLEMWEDALYAADQYWPLGSGTGTFDEVFQVHESLEYVSERKAGRAHSDWIEVALESGLFGVVLAVGWLVWAVFASWRQLRPAPTRPGPSWPGVAAGAGVAAIALQSMLDYPLRNQSLLCVAALLVVMLAMPRVGKRR